MTLFDQLYTAVTDTVIDFRDDLEKHDKRMIERNPGRRFLHFARPTGTDMVFFTPADAECWPLPGERIRFLFSTADRWHILNELANLASLHADRADQIHYFDGHRLHTVNRRCAEHLAAEWRAHIEKAWTNPTPELATTLAMRAVEQQEARNA